MGVFFSWLLGKPENELKEMRAERIEKLVKESNAEKVIDLVAEIEAIDEELKKHEAEEK